MHYRDCLSRIITGIPIWEDLTWATTPEQRDLLNNDYRKVVNALVARFRDLDPGAMNDQEVLTHRRNVQSPQHRGRYDCRPPDRCGDCLVRGGKERHTTRALSVRVRLPGSGGRARRRASAGGARPPGPGTEERCGEPSRQRSADPPAEHPRTAGGGQDRQTSARARGPNSTPRPTGTTRSLSPQKARCTSGPTAARRSGAQQLPPIKDVDIGGTTALAQTVEGPLLRIDLSARRVSELAPPLTRVSSLDLTESGTHVALSDGDTLCAGRFTAPLSCDLRRDGKWNVERNALSSKWRLRHRHVRR